MAGDWIKMRLDLQSHPKVVRILSATCTDKFRVIGGLHAVWSVFDAHTEDGILSGYTPETMDHIIGWPGFSQAMIDVGWLEYDGDQTLKMPEFQSHNGKSAKRRAEDAERKKESRKSPENVRNLSANSHTKTVTREEKRRDKENTKRKFVKPTVEEVRAYCNERGNGIDPQAFVDHYEANGWKRGSTPIKDWKACVRTWEAKRKESSPQRTSEGLEV